jgi:signal transduction histidine kinase
LSNAIKYSPHGGAIHFRLKCQPDTVTIDVQDSGIGIPEADQPKLFEPFHRAGNVETIQGTGLGLAVTKRAIELHGGSITFVSNTETGTTFTITLPIAQTTRNTD